MKKLDRRTVLRGAGGFALALPFLEAMLPRRASAAVMPPRRIIFVLTPNGFLMDKWKCAIPGTESRTVTLSPILSKLNPIRSECLFIEGVPMTSATDALASNPRTCAAGHPKGAAAVFTGSFAGEGDNYGGNASCKVGGALHRSIDQELARLTAGATRFPVLNVGAFPLDNHVARRCFYGANQALIDPQKDPAVVFQTLFSSVTPTPDQTARLRQVEERQHILDAVSGELRDLRCQLGASDRARLEQHAEEVSALRARVGLEAPASCTAPGAPAKLDLSNFANMPDVLDTQFKLITKALHCDLTRIVGLQIHAPDSHSQGIYTWTGHDLSLHQVSHAEGTDPLNRMVSANQWFAEQMLSLVNKLKLAKEADGSSVFDHTAIVWASEIGWNHNVRDVAWTILGKGQGYFDTGKYLKFSGDSSVRHNRLLVHFLRYMGINANGFGHPDYQGAPLPGVALG